MYLTVSEQSPLEYPDRREFARLLREMASSILRHNARTVSDFLPMVGGMLLGYAEPDARTRSLVAREIADNAARDLSPTNGRDALVAIANLDHDDPYPQLTMREYSATCLRAALNPVH